MIYIACPFWSPDEAVRKERRAAARAYARKLFKQGKNFVSPLCHSEGLASERPESEGFWVETGARLVAACDEVRVLTLPGWEASRGVAAEIAAAERKGIPVVYINQIECLSFHGSRTLTRAQCEPVILGCVERYQPSAFVTYAEPAGACAVVREMAKECRVALTLHYLDERRAQGMHHHRSVAVLEGSDRAIIMHDGTSRGTANELALCKKMGVRFDYFVLRGGALTMGAPAAAASSGQHDGYFGVRPAEELLA